ncbi:alpha-N-arabinofuranosidase [Granulicella pectinivorans]|uniref:non-reducing end alpha-L-arabinofuranosidase n=2 Tax=Granulicella pectinivorans TaxID=474950 RepID=A0A1I6MBH1_9BACT|nr:alpha-N-arabinofuranosidase [Granulicella pectinivorans]
MDYKKDLMPALRPAHLLVASLLTTACLAQVTAGRPMPKTVKVHVDPAGNQGTVPPHLFGGFLEPIDSSINNGVIAEILVNGSLEAGLWNHAMLEQIFRDQPELIDSTNQTGIPIPWQPLNKAAGNRYELHVGHAANSWQSLEIMGTPDDLTGIKQRVYLPVPRTDGYRVSLYARHGSGPTRLNVSLRSRSTDKILATASIEAAAGEWTKYAAKLQLKLNDVHRLEPVDFAISVEGDERVDLDQISLMPDDALGPFDPEVVRMSEDMHMTELRLGGNFISYYHWRDGIGPLDKRVTMENIAWGIPEYNNFGTDEFLAFCKLVHAEPQFNLNMGSGTPSEAADWVRYIRERYQGPLILEMGNELYGHWQVGYPTIHEIAPRTLAFSQALKPLAKDAMLMATGESPNQFEAWNAAQYTNPPGTFDLLTMHFITGTNHVRLAPYTPDFMAAAAYAVPHALGAHLDSMQAQMDAVPGYKGKAHFAITEWLFNSKGEGERNFTNESPSSRNEGGAVMVAATFNTYFRHNAEVKLVDMTGLMEFAGIWKRREQVFASPAYYVFQLYAAAKGDTVLPVTTDTGTYSVKNGTQGYADVADVPYVDIVATRSKDNRTITLFCVNRSLTDDAPTEIDLGPSLVSGVAKVDQMTAVSRYVMNDEVEPKRVVPQVSGLNVEARKPLHLTLPHESVTVIHLQAASK